MQIGWPKPSAGRAHPSYLDEKINNMRSLLTLVEELAEDDDRGPDAIVGNPG